MVVTAQFLDFLKEQMAGFGDVGMRKMFGGAGVYRRGLMIGLVADDVLYLKTDALTASEFESRGLAAFVYDRNGKAMSMSYRRAPPECLDDADEMALWCRKAHDAALRADSKRAAKMRPTKAKPAHRVARLGR